jgi:hypothetical protein
MKNEIPLHADRCQMFIFAVIHYTSNCVSVTAKPFDTSLPLQIPYSYNMATSTRAKISRTFVAKTDRVNALLTRKY